MHRDYLKEHHPIRFNALCLSGELWTYLADLNEQAQKRLELIVKQVMASEGVTEDMLFLMGKRFGSIIFIAENAKNIISNQKENSKYENSNHRF